MTRERILLISWLFLPKKSSVSFNLLKRIKESGYEFDVIAAGCDDAFAENVALFQGASSFFNIYRTKQPTGAPTESDVADAFVDEALSLIKELLATNHYRAMVSLSNEFASHLAAREIKKLRPSLRWLAIYDDPFGGNPYAKYYTQNFPPEFLAKEKEMLGVYDDIIVNNDWQKKLMLDWFGDPALAPKFHTLPHCFDPTFFRERLYANDKFIFSHIGMLYRHKRSSEPFIEAIKYLLATWPEYEGKFQVNFVGASDAHIAEYVKNGGGSHVSALPAVSYAESLDLMAEADALLLRDADFSEDGLSYSPFYAGKLADYLGAQKPVLAVTMEEGFTRELASEYPSLFCATEKETVKIAEKMKSLIDERARPLASTPNLTTFASGETFRKIIADDKKPRNILIAGHKLNFIDPFIEYLKKNTDFNILIDKWDGHIQHDEQQSRELLDQADVVFCEWGLGNLVWYSKNKKNGQKLITRIHAQELKTPYPEQTEWKNVDSVIVVGPQKYREFIKNKKFLQEKIKIIFNLIDYAPYDAIQQDRNGKRLGLIGCVPQSKRLDLAIDLFVKLWEKDNSFTLHIKGKKPDDYLWIKDNKKECDYFNSLFQKIAFLPCSKNIIFEPFGSDIPDFLARMDYILSPSDHESFHMSVAEGMGAGCVPVIRDWAGAADIYPSEFIFNSIDEMEDFILGDSPAKDSEKISAYARERFDARVLAPRVLELLK